MLPLFFLADLGTSTTIEVTGDEAHHAITVSRMSVGEQLILSDGQGNWATGEISAADKKSFTLKVLDRGHSPAQSPRLTVVQALPKSDRVKEAIELMVEAGADQIIPWTASRSISKWQEDSQEKWSTTALASTKQSRRFRIPVVKPARTSQEITSLISADTPALVLHESGDVRISQVVQNSWSQKNEILLIIGPEGGISPEELSLFTGAGAHVVVLGEPVFRSAHAAVAALSAVQALIGRW
jgi:16S rRNA (uracil1498-N3)-methyltransferase